MNSVLVGDCFNALPTLEAESVDLCVTSPPYWGLRDYGMTGQLGLEPHPQMFIEHLVELGRLVRDVLKPSGLFWLNLGDTYYNNPSNQNSGTGLREGNKTLGRVNRMTEKSPWLQPKQLLMIPSRVACGLQDDGWILRSDVIWHKPNHMPESVTDRFTKSYEHFFMFAKEPRYYFNLDAVREKYSPVSIARLSQPSIMSQMGGDKQESLHGGDPGNGNRPADILKGLSKRYNGKMVGDGINSEALGSPRARNSRPPPSIHDICPGCGESYSKHTQGSKSGELNYSMKPPYTITAEGIIIKACNPQGKNPGDVWEIPTQPFPGSHFAVFPEALVKRIIKCSSPPGGVVLDPFAGSGTTLRVARQLGRKFIGIELNPDYAKMAEERIRGKDFRQDLAGVSPLVEKEVLV